MGAAELGAQDHRSTLQSFYAPGYKRGLFFFLSFCGGAGMSEALCVYHDEWVERLLPRTVSYFLDE